MFAISLLRSLLLRPCAVALGTCVTSLSPAELLATITRFVELLLDKLHCNCPVLQTGTLGVTLTSYTVYVVANTEGLHAMLERRLSPVCVNPDGGHGAVVPVRGTDGALVPAVFLLSTVA